MKKLRQHYHWLTAGLVFLEMIVYGGLINSASVYVQPISQGLGVSTTSYSVALMPYTVSCFLGTCISGYLFSRFGYKKTALVSLALVAISLVLTAVAKNLALFCFSKILFGMGYGACFTAGSVRIIKLWFHKHQGLVLGAVSMASGLGGSLMTVLLNALTEKYGWRNANFVSAIIVAVIALLYLLLKDRPEEMGLQPFGYGQPMKVAGKAAKEAQDWPGYPMKEQFLRPQFYLMCLCVLVSCVCIYCTSSFLIPHFLSRGYSSGEAAMYQSVFMLTLAVFKLAAGWLYDLFGGKLVMVGCMSCAVVGQGMLCLSDDPIICMIAVMIFAVGLCMTSVVIPLMTGPLFGHRAYMSVNGIFLGLSSLAVLFSGPISSMCYDAYGTYIPVYRVTSLVNVGVLILYLLLFSMAKKERIRMAAQSAVNH